MRSRMSRRTGCLDRYRQGRDRGHHPGAQRHRAGRRRQESRGQVFQAMGRSEEARASFRQAIELDPDHSEEFGH